MKILIAGDHAGFELKAIIAGDLQSLGHEVIDVGPTTFDPHDDYPGYCISLARKLTEGEGDIGFLFGGSGEGEAIAANRVKGVRAAVYYGGSLSLVRLAREHNDANVLSLGSRFLSEEEARQAVELFLATPFSGEERHRRRIHALDD